MALLTTEPSQLTAGDTWSWVKSLSDYPADQGWSLKYSFLNATNKFSITATVSGSDHQIQVPATTTAGYTSGLYGWQAYASKGSERYQVGQGNLTVMANLDALTAYDGRSHARKVFEAICAVLENRATKDQEEYNIANRSLKRTPLGELLKLKNHYQALVRNEDNAERMAKGLPARNKILVRFGM